MKIALAALAVIAAPVYAADAVNWGGFTVRMVPVNVGEHVADVVIWNALTPIRPPDEADLSLGDVTCRVTALYGMGDVPDTVTVRCGDGYVAIPSEIHVNENSAATIEIFEAAAMPMG